jgi:two-component system sensor kinase FixL
VALPDRARNAISGRTMAALRLGFKVLLVGIICHLSTRIGFAHKIPPHYISPLWPTSAVLFSVLVATPVRHWWAYTLAAYVTSVAIDVRIGFSTGALLFINAGVLEILIAAVGVRRFADGLHAFDRLRSLVVYILVAAVFAPFASAFLAAFAGAAGDYWFFWRVWFLSEGLAYLTLAPAILTGIVAARTKIKHAGRTRWLEGCLIGGALVAVSVRVFEWPTVGGGSVAALVYLPLPLLLWAAVRFGPAGVNASLLVVAFLSISGAVHGRGPFTTGVASDNVLSLQMFLVALSVPLMFLAALIQEGHQKANILKESEARFRVMTDAAPMMVWMSDTDKRCSYFNAPWLEFTGRTREQELGNGWAEGVHADDLERCLKTYDTAFDAREPFQLEYRLRRRDGEFRWIIDYGVPRFAPDGGFAGYIGSCIDISDRRKAEDRFQMAIEAAPVAMILLDHQSRITLVNSQVERLFGYERRELLGQPIEVLLPDSRQHPNQGDFFTKPQAHSMGEGRELAGRRKDATKLPVEIGLSPIQADSGMFVLASVVDVSERRQVEEQRRELTHLSRVAILGELSGALAHELNQPLTAILSNAQAAQRLLAREPLDLTEVREILADIVAEDKRAGEVIRRLRALLKKGETQLQALDLNTVTSEVLDLAHADFVTRGVIVSSNLTADLPAVRGDRVQLQQVVLNLIVNACDAMIVSAPSERKLRIAATPNGNGMVQLSIADSGCGIPAEKPERLFQPFFTTKEQGMGLGLAICRSIVAAHGGQLWAVNNPDRGATFCLTLPAINGERS